MSKNNNYAATWACLQHLAKFQNPIEISGPKLTKEVHTFSFPSEPMDASITRYVRKLFEEGKLVYKADKKSRYTITVLQDGEEQLPLI